MVELSKTETSTLKDTRITVTCMNLIPESVAENWFAIGNELEICHEGGGSGVVTSLVGHGLSESFLSNLSV